MSFITKLSPVPSPAPTHRGNKESVNLNTPTSTINGLPVNILVAEDNRLQQRIIKNIETKELLIDIANDGEEAVEKVRDKSYQLIFMDFYMPNKDGAQAVKEIREFDKTTPIIVQSDSPRDVLEKNFNGLDIQGYLDGKLYKRTQVESHLRHRSI